MAVISVQQFREVLDKIYTPRRGRATQNGTYPEAELSSGEGNSITNIDLKLFIEDDGGDWDLDLIQKPTFNWDMKTISGNMIVDTGANSPHADLISIGVTETNGGLFFAGKSESRLESDPVLMEYGTTLPYVFNIWFKVSPDSYSNQKTGSLFELFDADTNDSILNLSLGIGVVEEGGFKLLFHYSGAGISGFSSDLYKYQDMMNVIVYYSPQESGVFINGVLLGSKPAQGMGISDTLKFVFGRGFLGEVFYCSLDLMGGSVTPNETYARTLSNLRFPLPRKPELVDLSDYFQQNGRDLLLDVGDISKAIENIKGQLFVKSNSIKVRN